MVSLSDITKATAGGESYIWLQSGWYKNRPLFIFSLALCALSCSLPPLSDLFLPVSPFFSGSLLEDLSSFYPYFFSTTSTCLFSLLSFFKGVHCSLDHRVYIHCRLKRLEENISGIPPHDFLLLSAALTTQTFILTTPSCIPVRTPTRNFPFWLIHL